MGRRKQILDAATRLFTRHGYEQISIQDINQACGIARGTFYLYFDNKDDLLNRILSRTITDVLDEIARQMDPSAVMPDPESEIAFIAETAFSYFKDKTELLKLIARSREFHVPVLENEGLLRFFTTRYSPYLRSCGWANTEIEPYITMKFLSIYTLVAFVVIKHPEKTDQYLKLLKMAPIS
ncbi:HTH-type transcriptional regulator BetI [Paenibacillus solanacearum]|uniref:HTH-type transcriptional regulator BetI n=1 Tax=Paenibacillus solanacearum TaxID=2048548 RepID=A0A916K9M9_9BACL|nr:TetR/AcrR family transcriptional regulator [Paenibacillus solanacearum]CAG7648652.1 HTH-type transcriptional regulator BetI [Paenibacillus solanacearum]